MEEAVSDYLAQIVEYGGEFVTVGAMIADLQRIAATLTADPARQQAIVARYMQGHAQTRGCG